VTRRRRLVGLALPAGFALILWAWPASARAQQVPDTTYRPTLEAPAYPSGGGPTVAIDAAHHNFHTMDGRYRAFADLLSRDGYRVRANETRFSTASLATMDVLVISNALHEQSAAGFAPLPNLSAFTDAEIVSVEDWVAQGGSLLLIADHMPIAGHAEALAGAFGVRFHNGFVFGGGGGGQITFRRSDGSLATSAVTNGRGSSERVDSVTSFTGQAFRLDPGLDAEPLMTVPEGYTLLMPRVAWQFSDSTPRIPAANLLQGALVRHGRGRVAVFGEAAMFSAQLAGSPDAPMGMNHPAAAENYRFVLNILHWLTGVAGVG
jgi:hypothetical protein